MIRLPRPRLPRQRRFDELGQMPTVAGLALAGALMAAGHRLMQTPVEQIDDNLYRKG